MTMYRWFIEYVRANRRGKAFVRAENETEARSQFRSLYLGAWIEHITCLGDAEISDRAHQRARCVP
jgi:hypothetical protein